MEFFKDETSRRCNRCGHRLSNPRIALDCASWCDQAEACLGVARATAAKAGREEAGLAGRLIQALEAVLQHDQARFDRALLVFQHARELASAVGVSPGLVLPAALLLELEGDPGTNSGDSSSQTAGEAGSLPQSEEFLSRAGVDADSIARITGLLSFLRNRREEECAEVRVLEDSLTLAEMTLSDRPADPKALEGLIETRLRTEAGRARARQLFLPLSSSSSPATFSQPVSENGTDA